MFPGESCERLIPWPFVRSHRSSARFRKDRFGQAEGESRSAPPSDRGSEDNQYSPHNGGVGAWLRNRWTRVDCGRVEQRRDGSIGTSTLPVSRPQAEIAARPSRSDNRRGRLKSAGITRFRWLILLLFLLPFEDTRQQTAQATYDHALHLLQQGDLVKGQQETTLGFQRFRSSNPIWAAKFELLLAEFLLYRGMYDSALDLLSSYNASTNQENTAQKLAIESIALTRQEKLPLASQRLTRAESICSNNHLASCGDVDTARAIFEIKQGQLDE